MNLKLGFKRFYIAITVIWFLGMITEMKHKWIYNETVDCGGKGQHICPPINKFEVKYKETFGLDLGPAKATVDFTIEDHLWQARKWSFRIIFPWLAFSIVWFGIRWIIIEFRKKKSDNDSSVTP